jgi:hypothetical protein
MLEDVASETEANLPEDVREALLARGPSLGGHDFLVLPHQTRSGTTYYVEDDLEALLIARSEGLDAAFLHDGPDRRFLHENAAGWELTAALSVAEGVTVLGIGGLARFLAQRIRRAKDQGLYAGDESTAPIKLTVAEVRQDSETGDVIARALKIEGNLAEVIAAVERLRPGTNE